MRTSGSRWPVPVMALIGFLAGLGVSLGLTVLVLGGGDLPWDQDVLHWFQSQQSPWLDGIVSEISVLGGGVVLTLLTVATVGLLVCLGQQSALRFFLICVLGAQGITVAAKFGVDRPRPVFAEQFDLSLQPSFPSGHAMMAVAVYLSLAALAVPRLASRAAAVYVVSLAVLLAMAIGTSRLYLGVHYLTDVLAGWAAGLSWVSLCFAGRWLLGDDSPSETASANRGS